MNDDTADNTHEANHISTLRRHLLDQVKALRAAGSTEEMQREIDRSKAVAELAQAVVNTAKVEVDYLKATGQDRAGFLEEPPQITSDSSGAGLPDNHPANGISSITRHRLRG